MEFDHRARVLGPLRTVSAAVDTQLAFGASVLEMVVGVQGAFTPVGVRVHVSVDARVTGAAYDVANLVQADPLVVVHRTNHIMERWWLSSK